ENVLKNLDDKTSAMPIRKDLLNQKFFSGIGNYLHAEILYSLKIPLFKKFWTVLEALKDQEQAKRKKNPSLALSKKLKLMEENPDLLELPKKLFDSDHSDNYTAFKNWRQCYLVPNVSSLHDPNSRTIWFQLGVWGRCLGLGQISHKKHAQLKADPKDLSPKVTTCISKTRPRATAKPSKLATEEVEEVEEVADRPRKGHAHGRRKATAAAASSEPEVPVKAKRSCQMSARRGRGEAGSP
ncbi:NEIL1 Endonuclease, partial [Steatornis caripensis]|nr:NEIL1 Endonuclease [Steatornis caripensis]